jgi:hypothetical protein
MDLIRDFPVRYGHTYKVVLCITLPTLLIVPFILIMSRFKSLPEWQVWTLISLFIGFIVGISLWLVFRVYPKAILKINRKEISLLFNHEYLLTPQDFTFNVSDIVSLKKGALGNGDFYNFEIKNPSRRFQISAISYEMEDLIDFYESMMEIEAELDTRDSKNY